LFPQNRIKAATAPEFLRAIAKCNSSGNLGSPCPICRQIDLAKICDFRYLSRRETEPGSPELPKRWIGDSTMTLRSKLFAALLVACALCTGSIASAHGGGGGGVRVGIGLGFPGCYGGYCGYPYYGYPYAYPYPYYAPAPVYYVPSPTVIQQPVYVQQPVAQQMAVQSPPQQYNYQPNNAPQQTFQSQPAAAAPANNNTTQQWVPGHWVTKPISAGSSTQPAAAQQYDQNSPPPLPRPSVQ
jgi:hypothetical protein